MTHRLYIYNLVARNFHRHSAIVATYLNSDSTYKVELDDFVFDQHTIESERGMEHF